MKYLKNILKLFIYIIIISIIFSFLAYKNIINDKVLNIIQITTVFYLTFIFSFKLGKNKEKNGYIEGIIFGLSITILFLIINIIFIKNLNIHKMIYYLMIIIISILGSILGINKKTKA